MDPQRLRRAAGGRGRFGAAALVGAAALFVCLAACRKGQDSAAGAEKDKPVARVNGADIPQGMVDNALEMFLAQRPPGTPDPSPEQRATLRNDVVEALINQELLLQKARGDGMGAGAEDVARRMQTLETRYESHEAMLKGLERAGMSEEQVKKLVERSLTIDAYLEKHVRSQVSVGDAEVEAYFKAHPEQMNRPELVRASHILILAEEGKATPEERQQARARAQTVLERVRKGEDFAALAKDNSADGSASRGGDLGFFPRGQMTPSFEKAAFTLKVGQVSGVVETPYGYHIIKVTERQPARALKLAEVREAVRRRLHTDQAEKRSREFVESLRAEAQIERLMAPVAGPVSSSR